MVVDRGILQVFALPVHEQKDVLRQAMAKWDQVETGESLHAMGIDESPDNIVRPQDEVQPDSLDRLDVVAALVLGDFDIYPRRAFGRIESTGVLSAKLWNEPARPGAYFQVVGSDRFGRDNSARVLNPQRKDFDAKLIWEGPLPFLRPIERLERLKIRLGENEDWEADYIKSLTLRDKLAARAMGFLGIKAPLIERRIEEEMAIHAEIFELMKMSGDSGLIVLEPGVTYLAPVYPAVRLENLEGAFRTKSGPARLTLTGAMNSDTIYNFSGIITTEMAQFTGGRMPITTDVNLFQMSFKLRRYRGGTSNEKTFGGSDNETLAEYVWSHDWADIMLPRGLKVQKDEYR